MKLKASITVATLLLAITTGTACANNSSGQQPQEITRHQTDGHKKIGRISVTQQGFTMDNEKLKNKVAEKGGSYYVIIAEQGQETHKTTEADIYK
ncbi:MAG: YdgH/BhsA/McbA-like domain containing protein [Citrobacter sp.]|uniref:YdgH/BhsA/McbA-like domain containing protein n=1 Tax=Citrobacter TaxID=544 RepID=UPI001EF064F5|nr:YdgH/BhsA/McbA-like domain containing protein [Citrobacter freundii]